MKSFEFLMPLKLNVTLAWNITCLCDTVCIIQIISEFLLEKDGNHSNDKSVDYLRLLKSRLSWTLSTFVPKFSSHDIWTIWILSGCYVFNLNHLFMSTLLIDLMWLANTPERFDCATLTQLYQMAEMFQMTNCLWLLQICTIAKKNYQTFDDHVADAVLKAELIESLRCISVCPDMFLTFIIKLFVCLVTVFIGTISNDSPFYSLAKIYVNCGAALN